MSFRVNASHNFLKPPQAAPPKKTIDDLLKLESKSDDKYDWLTATTTTTSTSSAVASAAPERKARVNASQGLVISQNPRAQEDYM
jgi:hypothetical protein